MSTNAGRFDRVFRLVLGALLVALASTGYVGPLGYLGAVGVLTGLTGFCPAYKVLGIRTCRTPDAAPQAPGSAHR